MQPDGVSNPLGPTGTGFSQQQRADRRISIVWEEGPKGRYGRSRMPLLSLWFHVIDGPAAIFCSTLAAHRPDVGRKVIIHGQLLAFVDLAVAVIQDVPLQDVRGEIGIATMVNELGAASAHAAVDAPIVIQRENVIEPPPRAPLRFAAADLFA